MTNGRVVRLRRENADLRRQVDLLRQLVEEAEPDEELTPYEQIQEDAIGLVSRLTTLPWMSHQMFREVASAILTESSGALDVLDAGGSLDEYREREW